MTSLQKYVIHLADNALILGQRLGEWCGHGPVLEQDIALTNISLDLIGQARMLCQYSAELAGPESTEDSIAFLRHEHEYLNCLLVEQPNGHFGNTIMRQFLFDAYSLFNLDKMRSSSDSTLAAIAERSIKEVQYHFRLSSQWVIRLGDGTELSHTRMQDALQTAWPFTGELFTPTDYEEDVCAEGIGPDIKKLEKLWLDRVTAVLNEATLKVPDDQWMQTGGKTGRHTEQMGYILSDLQYMQRAYPEMQW